MSFDLEFLFWRIVFRVSFSEFHFSSFVFRDSFFQFPFLSLVFRVFFCFLFSIYLLNYVVLVSFFEFSFLGRVFRISFSEFRFSEFRFSNFIVRVLFLVFCFWNFLLCISFFKLRVWVSFFKLRVLSFIYYICPSIIGLFFWYNEMLTLNKWKSSAFTLHFCLFFIHLFSNYFCVQYRREKQAAVHSKEDVSITLQIILSNTQVK